MCKCDPKRHLKCGCKLALNHMGEDVLFEICDKHSLGSVDFYALKGMAIDQVYGPNNGRPVRESEFGFIGNFGPRHNV